jgi:DNA-binding NarL/FixJ family response regulator
MNASSRPCGAGASGFLLKDTPPTDLLAAVRVGASKPT